MDISRSFDKTLKKFNLSAREVAQESGVTEGVISKFRNSRQTIQTDTFDKLMSVLSDEAKIYFFSLLLGKEINIEMLVSGMDAATLSELLLIIANKINPKKKKQTEKKDTKSEISTIEDSDQEDKARVIAN